MRKLKFISVLSVILTVIACACTVSSYASEYDDTAEVHEVLRKINVITDEEHDPNSGITRVKYLEMVLQAIKFDSSTYVDNAKQIFFDVPADDENAALINLGFDMGIITGHPDGRFCPENSITLDEAVIMAIRAAGAEDFMNATGGWMQSAASLDLLDKVSVEAGSAISRTNAERVIFNMLNASLVDSDNGKEWYLNGESSLLELKHSLERATGIVDANSFANLYGGNKLPTGQISVNDTVYEVDSEFDGLFIGENVVFYYEKDRYSGQGEKIVYICSGRNELVQADTEMTETLNSSVFEYYVNDKKEKMQISPKAITLENGIKTTMPVSGYSLPKYGKIKAIDNNNDGKADVILVTDITIGMVNIVVNEVIYFQNKPATNIKLEEYERVVIKNKAGETLTLEDVTAGVLTEICAASDKSYIEITVITDTASVMVKGLEQRSENGYSVWYVSDSNGISLRTVRDFEEICPENELTVGGSYTVLLNSDGYIAAIISETASDAMKYGYVLKSFEREPVGEGNVVLRVLTAEGVVAEFLTEEKLSDVSAKGRILNTQLLSLCADKQVIRYGLNTDGNINKIEFASSDPTADGLKIGGTTSSGNNGLSRYYTSTSLIGGEIAVNKQTVIFMVPDAENENDLSKYNVAGINYLVNEKYYKNMTAYVYGDDVYAKAIVYNSNVTSVVRDSSRMIVSHTIIVYDEADNVTKKALVGYVDGKEKTCLIEDENVLKYTPSRGNEITVDEGDIIRYETDVNGKINYIKLVFDRSEQTLYGTTDGNDDSVTYGSDVVHTYGTVAEKFDNYFRVIRNGHTEKSSYLYPVTSATYIYEYDSTKKRDQRIRIIAFAEVMALEDDIELTDKIVMISRAGTLPFMVIYK